MLFHLYKYYFQRGFSFLLTRICFWLRVFFFLMTRIFPGDAYFSGPCFGLPGGLIDTKYYAVPSVQVLFATRIFISVDAYFFSSPRIFLKLRVFFSRSHIRLLIQISSAISTIHRALPSPDEYLTSVHVNQASFKWNFMYLCPKDELYDRIYPCPMAVLASCDNDNMSIFEY